VQNADMEAECEAVFEYDDKAVAMIAHVEHALKTLTMEEVPKEERSIETKSRNINLQSGPTQTISIEEIRWENRELVTILGTI